MKRLILLTATFGIFSTSILAADQTKPAAKPPSPPLPSATPSPAKGTTTKQLTPDQMKSVRQILQLSQEAQSLKQKFDQIDLARYRVEEQMSQVNQSASQIKANVEKECGGTLQQQQNTVVCLVTTPAPAQAPAGKK